MSSEPGEYAAWDRIAAEGRKKLDAVLKAAGLEIPYAPSFDTVLVLREPSKPTVTKIGAIHIPEKFQEEPEPESTGYLVGGGLAALDYFRDHGYVIGDRVQIGRFAGWEKEFAEDAKAQKENRERPRKILQMTTGDLKGSFDLKERLWGPKPTMRIVYEAEHVIRPI